MIQLAVVLQDAFHEGHLILQEFGSIGCPGIIATRLICLLDLVVTGVVQVRLHLARKWPSGWLLLLPLILIEGLHQVVEV
jgi:hypothetical protein